MKLGTFVRHVHFIGAGILIGSTLFGPRSWSPWLVLFWFLMIVSNLMAGGCPLTRWEIYQTKENVTIIDPFLNYLGLLTNKTNRNGYTLGVGIIMIIIAMIKTVTSLL